MTEAKELSRGSYILHNGEILRVIKKETVAYGTHSHSKTKLYLQGLTSRGEKSINLMHHDKVEELNIIRKSGQVVSKMTDKIQVMDSHSFETLDAGAEQELLAELNEGDQVTFIDHNGAATILEKR